MGRLQRTSHRLRVSTWEVMLAMAQPEGEHTYTDSGLSTVLLAYTV